MNLATALELAAAFLGLASGVFFSVGVLHVKDATLHTIATSMWGKGEVIAVELAQQKTDFIFGAFLLALSFVVQVVGKCLPSELALSAVATSISNGAFFGLGAPAVFLVALYLPYRWHRKKSVQSLQQQIQGQL